MSEKAKDKIIRSAIEIISKKGYSAATTSEIAKTAGYSEATIFKYFNSKKGLFDAVINSFTGNIAESVGLPGVRSIIKNDADLKFEKIVDLIIEDRVRFIENNYEFLKILLAEIQFHEGLRNKAIEHIIIPVLKDATDLIKKQIKSGNIIEVDPIILFRTIFSGIFMSVLPRMLMNQPLDIKMLREELKEVKKILLHGAIK